MALSSAQESFARKVAKATGLQVATVRAWVAAEGGPDDNPLNIMGWTSAGVRYIRHFGTSDKAAAATVSLLRKPIYAGVTSAAVKYDSPIQELEAIAASPWEENHYKGNSNTPGSLLLGAYRALVGTSTTPVDVTIPLPGLPDPKIPLPGPDVTIPTPWGGTTGTTKWLLDHLGLSNITTWVEAELAKAFAYAALTTLALALGGLGLLKMLGASPAGLVRSIAPAKARASGSQSDDIPF